MFHLQKTKTIGLFAIVIVQVAAFYTILAPRPALAAPQCFSFDGSREVTCNTNAETALDENGCYTERRSGPNGTLTGYTETSCDDPTDRDQDGDPGGAGSTPYKCGEGSDAVGTTFNIGCKGIGNPIIDMLFALIRFLSAGVGVILVIAMIITGIQHIIARDKPEATANLIKRLLTLAGAIVLYALAFALLNFLIPGGLLI